MNLLNKFVISIMSIFLVLLSFSPIVKASENGTAKYRMKDEVVYATLSPNGNNESAYVVNVFEVTKEGTIVDYGKYSKVKNMTNLTEIRNGDDRVKLEVDEGKFYYQGDMEQVNLPWDIAISYDLDGREISPNDLLGKDGKVEITIHSEANETVDATFFEHYMLQISLTFDVERFSNIKAEDATIANAGKTEQVTFTILPGEEAELSVTADVVNFEMEGIDITGIPFTIALEELETDEMVEDMDSLSEAIATIHDGVGVLNDGVRELTDGTGDLHEGSKQFYEGLTNLNRASSSLVDGSKEINNALRQIENQLSFMTHIQFSELEALVKGLDETSDNLRKIAKGLNELKINYTQDYHALDQAIGVIPSPSIELTNDEKNKLLQSGVSKDKVNHILKTYESAQLVKKTYRDLGVKKLFSSIEDALRNTINGLLEIANGMDQMSAELQRSFAELEELEQIEQFVSGIEQFVKQYGLFHQGLIDYTKGVDELTHVYGKLHGGISELRSGTGELSSGTIQLHDGTKKLSDETANLPEDIQDEIDEFLKTYDHSDFEPVSFVSNKNDNIGLVQFVLKTSEIKHSDEKEEIEAEKETKGFWQMLKDLFIRN